MRRITWLTPAGETYVAGERVSQEDTAVPTAPGPDFVFNRESWEWEQTYEQPHPSDISIPEAEEVWRLAHTEGNVLAGVMLKALGL
jgi:hypothetical protein